VTTAQRLTSRSGSPGGSTRYSTAPRVPNTHLFSAGKRDLILSVTTGRIYEIDEILAATLDRTMDFGDSDRVGQMLSAAGILDQPVSQESPGSVQLSALSLAVAQKCNLGCTYCYAQQGNFGGPTTNMPVEVAQAAVDRLLNAADPGTRVSLAFLGGEPLANRDVLREITTYAIQLARHRDVSIAFGITTNGTLMTEDDVALTVSVDGIGAPHDSLRPFKSGKGSYEQIMERCAVMLSRSRRRARMIARVSVTPKNLDLRNTLDELLQSGFDGVQFSPVLNSFSGMDQMNRLHLTRMLDQMLNCADAFKMHLTQGRIYPFLNVITTLRQIHQRRQDAFPCGAGGGYFGVSANGGFYSCHRFVNEEIGAMGNVSDGIDKDRQRTWLIERNVHKQEPCQTCWARYLCSGGCHHEAIHRGRPACDYIRGWVDYCLGLYSELMTEKPHLLNKLLTENS
jgi:uncharacterized protein